MCLLDLAAQAAPELLQTVALTAGTRRQLFWVLLTPTRDLGTFQAAHKYFV